MNKIIKLLLKSKSFPLKSQGSSMLPILRSADVVYFKKINFKNLKANDLVLVKKNHQLFTHRVIYKTDKHLVTKGDNNPQSDGKIYPIQIIGKVIKVKRDGKEFDPNQIYLLQSSLYFQEIIKIKEVFEKEKLDFVFLKGLPLHLYYEKEHPRRIYADCDVLVDKKDFLKAENIVLKLGYKKTEAKNKQVENNYFKVISGFSVIFDLHLEPAFLMTQFSGLEALYPQKLIDKLTTELLKTKRKVRIQDTNFYFLSINFQILYLSLHFFHHNFLGAFRLDFLNKVIKKSHLSNKDWLKIAQITNKYQLTNFVSPVFVLLKKYYQPPLPDFMNFMYGSVVTDPYFKNSNIFDDEPRIGAGINRFKNIFFLSPYPLWRKLTVFFHPQVIYFIFWVLGKKLSSFFLKGR